MLVIFLRIVSGFFCAIIAYGKGRSAIFRLLFGILFGFIALVLILILPTTLQKKAEEYEKIKD